MIGKGCPAGNQELEVLRYEAFLRLFGAVEVDTQGDCLGCLEPVAKGRWFRKIVCPSGKCSCEFNPGPGYNIADHVSMFKAHDGSKVLVMQPYGVYGIEELQTRAEKLGLKLFISSELSWWYPGNTVLIAVVKKDFQFPR